MRPRRLARPRTPPFHGDNTGSNPVGDANKIKDLQAIHRIDRRPITSNKMTSFRFPLYTIENQPGDSPLRCAFYVCHRLRVEVHRDAAVRMS